MNCNRKLCIFIMFFLLSCCVYGKMVTINYLPILAFNSEETLSDSLTDSRIFHIDDSLLCEYYPAATSRPISRNYPDNMFTHELKFHFTPVDTQTQSFLIITTSNLYDSLTSELRTYAEDVHSIYGYGIYLETSDYATPEQLKSIILNYQHNLCGVLFVGNVGECLFEIENDYGQDGYRIWPCDLYFMDLDGIWTDSDGNGIYDLHTGNVAPEIYVARLSAVGMESLGSEIYLIKNQLQKSHDFWWKTSYHGNDTVLNYIDETWNDDFYPSVISTVFPSGNVVDVRYNGPGSLFSPSDYLSRLYSGNYGFTQLAAHSAPDKHMFTTGNVYLNSIINNQSNNFAYHLFCCSACNWMAASNQGYLGGAYLFNQGKTMTVIGTTKTGGMWAVRYFYSRFSSYNIGDSFVGWWNQMYGNTHSSMTISWNYGLTVLGDPTIYLRHSVNNVCENNQILTSFPNNNSNLVLFRAGNSIRVSDSFVIPQGVHVVFDAPIVEFDAGFTCPVGASFETRNEGCEL